LLPINIVGNTYTAIHHNRGKKRKLSFQEFKVNTLFDAIAQLRNCLWQARSVGCSWTPSFFSSIVPSRPGKDRAQSRPRLFP
jgi:hypothetical protein